MKPRVSLAIERLRLRPVWTSFGEHYVTVSEADWRIILDVLEAASIKLIHLNLQRKLDAMADAVLGEVYATAAKALADQGGK